MNKQDQEFIRELTTEVWPGVINTILDSVLEAYPTMLEAGLETQEITMRLKEVCASAMFEMIEQIEKAIYDA